jgi:hypothetical protein
MPTFAAAIAVVRRRGANRTVAVPVRVPSIWVGMLDEVGALLARLAGRLKRRPRHRHAEGR